MLSDFIKEIEWMTFHLADNNTIYPGFSARCYFYLPAYRDDMFFLAGIPLTAEMERSVPKRRAEFLAGRYLAKQVLERLGISDFVLQNGRDRSPQWPATVSGSLSHNVDSAFCAAHFHSETFSCIGLDVETVMTTERADSLWPGIVDEVEYNWLRSQDQITVTEMLTLNFSAKESLYKALYPHVKRYFDFLDVRMVELDTIKQIFTLELRTALAPDYPAGRCFRGIYRMRERDVTTFICC
ncbi:4'-phosphopantetheinyl transferase [Prodigiosinella confusarubida]|uniref:Enterobactin synthase component D n=1 Tax=Serratia sp. (strain ATCC 39006) TaxID=104623 RepID=A0A2I5TPZ5_SERS3|nr:4'-phosphopantetheinyl transferase superfamily protein [Serratia sp. ATCC 39006]AUH02319.1 4'-phosphopantetheinyl transferase [Serratia sp. ATCC 39006]AUH06641.1 4'-phosphopantetheinyl transferase [Serratia sp. ATCC 39006]